ncbi:hypothetical protein GEV33_011330 [Tenebrio molitor]|uniref:Uncharacterized protein n=1 Tax=Tenebrio molitor TaxID=7067 RepID=A0A8J6LFZ2_TENMO|nr:hypothetical protein GEV33_011330 [Tenebrio molitor]
MGISGAMRRDELTKMSIDDIKDEHSVLIVAVPETKTGIKRTFTVTNPEFGVMKAFVARDVTLGPETPVEGHNTLRATNANYARATFNLGKLKEIIKECDYEDMNQTRFSESVIIFTLKYGVVYNENFFECMKMLIDAAVDVNKFDFSGKFAIDYIAMYYRENKNDGRVTDDLKRVGRLLLDKGVCQIDNTKTREFVQNELDIDLSTYTYVIMDDLTKLFYWIVNYSIIEFLSFDKIRKFVDCDNGENTILQFASKKSERLLPVVKFLLNNGADPNKTTNRNELTPLELAAYKNHQAIFEEILKNKRTKITQDHLNNFVKGRSHPIKPKLFEIFLESDKLNPNLTYKKTGNTPLHYAIYFSHKNAIQKLLKRSKISLTIKNNAGKCAFDMIDGLKRRVIERREKGVETSRVRLEEESRKSKPRRRGADLRIPDGRFVKNQTPECGVKFHARISSSTVGPRNSPMKVQVSRDVDRPVTIKARVIEKFFSFREASASGR